VDVVILTSDVRGPRVGVVCDLITALNRRAGPAAAAGILCSHYLNHIFPLVLPGEITRAWPLRRPGTENLCGQLNIYYALACTVRGKTYNRGPLALA
jgi:hypothetical protein